MAVCGPMVQWCESGMPGLGKANTGRLPTGCVGQPCGTKQHSDAKQRDDSDPEQVERLTAQACADLGEIEIHGFHELFSSNYLRVFDFA